MYKQIIIARKDLNMSPGKLSAQVSHASMAFLTNMLRNNTKRNVTNVCYAYDPTRPGENKPQHYRRGDLNNWAEETRNAGKRFFYVKPVDQNKPYGALELCDPIYEYNVKFKIDIDLFEQWINGSFTKVVCKAKNRNQLLKAKTIAEELGLKEGEDFFLIKDNCRTELEPEEIDENGVGRTLTCIGFKPLDSEIANKISKKFHLYM